MQLAHVRGCGLLPAAYSAYSSASHAWQSSVALPAAGVVQPDGQAVQSALPAEALKLPWTHGAHVGLPSAAALLLKKPALQRHCSPAVVPASLTLLLAQSRHTPAPGWYVFSGHASHAVRSDVLVVPGLQRTHALLPGVTLWWPTRHSKQLHSTNSYPASHAQAVSEDCPACPVSPSVELFSPQALHVAAPASL